MRVRWNTHNTQRGILKAAANALDLVVACRLSMKKNYRHMPIGPRAHTRGVFRR